METPEPIYGMWKRVNSKMIKYVIKSNEKIIAVFDCR
jgi:hypothetical protein